MECDPSQHATFLSLNAQVLQYADFRSSKDKLLKYNEWNLYGGNIHLREGKYIGLVNLGCTCYMNSLF